MNQPIRVEDMSAGEIAAILTADGKLSKELAIALHEFIEKVGGLENAYRAVEMLGELEDAA